MKKTIIAITPELFRELMQLPDNAILEGIEVPFNSNGALNLKLSGVGLEVSEGGVISIAKPGTITKDEYGVSINWNFPD